MIIDSEDVTSNSLDCDLCIIGAGAAGITLAREFAGSRTRVILLEAGGYQVEHDTQALYRGQNVGHPYFDLDDARLRVLGGTTGHWGGACWPLEPIDFTVRDWVPHSGWPIARNDLDRYYEKAQRILQIGEFNYDPVYWQDKHEAPLLPFSSDTITSKLYQNSPPTRFGTVYRGDLARAKNVTTILHANVTHLQLREGGQALHQVQVASLGGKKFRVNAKQYVLAVGGLENPRLLLNADDVVNTGIGNGHDQVGRYFMDHPLVFYSATMLLDGNASLRFYSRHGLTRGGLGFSADTQRSERILNTWIGLNIKGAPGPPHGWHDNTVPPSLFTRDVDGFVSDMENLAGATTGKGVRSIRLMCHSEQAPNPDSRALLDAERDALGMRRLKLDWRLTDFDRFSVHRSMELLGMELGAAGLGRLRIDLDGDEHSWADPAVAATINHPWGSFHHIGTTRMHDDPRQGVVDRNCRIHGVHNFYVAGSSVFPTSGYANPTLTIVALACRLGDHLKTTLA
jgi:choline dehydrogenase-like flavoprotein